MTILHGTVLYSTSNQIRFFDRMSRKKRVTITVNLGDDEEVNFKKLIKALSRSDHADNIYADRSESDIVKMLLAKKLIEEHRRFVGSPGRESK